MKVSIVTCTLNASRHLQNCIDSVKKQDYQGQIEHWCIDGGSTDETIKIAEENGLNIISENDRGIYDAFNKGVANCTGDVVHILNADDKYTKPNVITQAIQILASDDIDVCHARIRQIDNNGNEITTAGKDCTVNQLRKKMRIAHPSLFVKKTVYEKFGSFNPCFKIAGDHEFCLRIWSKVKKTFVDEYWIDMAWGGASSGNARKSYLESCSAAILHGEKPIVASIRCHLEIIKHKILFFNK